MDAECMNTDESMAMAVGRRTRWGRFETWFRSFVVGAMFVTLGFGGGSLAAGEEAPTTKSAKDLSEARVTYDVVYKKRDDVELRCDVYLPPTKATEKGYPTIIAIHGGGWMAGDKWTMGTHCQHLATEGFAVVSINYRHAPKYKFPAQADDVRDALLWVVREKDHYKFDLQRVGLFGYSAGGHLASLIAMCGDSSFDELQPTTTWEKDDTRWNDLPKVKAVCAGGPPCDFRPIPEDNRTLAYFLGGARREIPEVYVAASPASHVSRGDPPIQIIHGDKDLIVPIENSRGMFELLSGCGVDARFETIVDQGHMITFMHPKTVSVLLNFFRELL